MNSIRAVKTQPMGSDRSGEFCHFESFAILGTDYLLLFDSQAGCQIPYAQEKSVWWSQNLNWSLLDGETELFAYALCQPLTDQCLVRN